MLLTATAAGEAAKRQARALAAEMPPMKVAELLELDLATYWLLCLIDGEKVIDTTRVAQQMGLTSLEIDERARVLIAKSYMVDLLESGPHSATRQTSKPNSTEVPTPNS